MSISLNSIINKLLVAFHIKNDPKKTEESFSPGTFNNSVMDIITNKLHAKKTSSCLILIDLVSILQQYDNAKVGSIVYEHYYIEPSLNFNKIAEHINVNVFAKIGVKKRIKYMPKEEEQEIIKRLGISSTTERSGGTSINVTGEFFNATDISDRYGLDKSYEIWRSKPEIIEIIASMKKSVSIVEYETNTSVFLHIMLLPIFTGWISSELFMDASKILKNFYIGAAISKRDKKIQKLEKKMMLIKNIIN